MGRLVESLQVLLAYQESAAPEVREATLQAARALAADAEALSIHARRMDETAVFVGNSLSHDAREIEESLERGNVPRTRYLIREVTDNCVACHARLPGDDSPRAEAFVSSTTLARLPARERARLQIATRRFQDALDTLEGLLLSPDSQPVVLIDPLIDYLIVSVRVLRDFERPVPVLRSFAARRDVWRQLGGEARVWADALPELERRMPERPDLVYARRLIEEGRALTDFAADRSGLAHDVVASGILLGLVEAGTNDPQELAETFYWLAVLSSRIAHGFGLSAADFFLERAIRLAPAAPFASEAYALLEQEELLSYEGVDEELPPEEQRRLAELRELVDGASP